MIIHYWKLYRWVIILGMITCFIWLVYWVPALGFFSVSFSEPPLTENGALLVFFKEGVRTSEYSLTSYTMGWGVVKEIWPLILFGVMLGYPFGEYIVWRIGVQTLYGKALKNHDRLSRELAFRELKIGANIKKNFDQLAELSKVKNEVKLLQKKLYETRYLAGEQKKSYKALQRKNQFLEKELLGTKAKIRRLMNKKTKTDSCQAG